MNDVHTFKFRKSEVIYYLISVRQVKGVSFLGALKSVIQTTVISDLCDVRRHKKEDIKRLVVKLVGNAVENKEICRKHKYISCFVYIEPLSVRPLFELALDAVLNTGQVIMCKDKTTNEPTFEEGFELPNGVKEILQRKWDLLCGLYLIKAGTIYDGYKLPGCTKGENDYSAPPRRITFDPQPPISPCIDCTSSIERNDNLFTGYISKQNDTIDYQSEHKRRRKGNKSESL